MNATATKIFITSMMVGDQRVEVPAGLSELLEDTWVSERPQQQNGYTSETRLVDGQFTTYLRKGAKA